MMRKSLLVGVIGGVALVVGTAMPANAAAPSNDDINTPVTVGALPYQNTQDTSEATVAASDPFSGCGFGPAATVWYSFTPNSSGAFAITTVGSDYDTTLAVFTGTEGALNEVTCNDDFNSLQSAVVLTADAGTTYLIMAGTCCGADVGTVGPGGTLVLNVSPATPPSINVSLNRRGTVGRDGTAHVSGTIRCTPGNQGTATWFLSVYLTQRFSRLFAAGGNQTSGVCDSTTTAWSLNIGTFTSVLFGGGPASATVDAFACDDVQCTSIPTMTVRVNLAGHT